MARNTTVPNMAPATHPGIFLQSVENIHAGEGSSDVGAAIKTIPVTTVEASSAAITNATELNIL